MLKNMPIALTIDRKPARTTVPYGMAQMASGRSSTRAECGNALNSSGFLDQAICAEWNLLLTDQERFQVLL